MPAETPLASAFESFLADRRIVPFTTPGHKRAPWLVDGLLARDGPLATGADDGHLSGGLLQRAEALAADLWGADWCRFSVNGSTHGNQALALAVARPGERVLVSRNLHKSLFHGLVLAGLAPVWLQTSVESGTGLPAIVSPERVGDALAADPGLRAVFLVEPSFVGAVSDIRAIADVAHAAGAALVVDQAWGAHLGFHGELPQHALAQGADAMVTSAHKTLTAFTQGALVLAQGGRVDYDRLEQAFAALNTTSPSAAIYASLDRARALLAERGAELLDATIRLARRARSELGAIAGLALAGAGSGPGAYDPTRLALALAGTGANGFEVEADLWADGVRLEMADRDTLVPLVTIGDSAQSVERLVTALRRSIEARRGEPRSVLASSVWAVAPDVAMTPREAFFALSERVPADEAVGRIAAETIVPYPPGIPAVALGERISRASLDALRAEIAAGGRLPYGADPLLGTVSVVADASAQ